MDLNMNMDKLASLQLENPQNLREDLSENRMQTITSTTNPNTNDPNHNPQTFNQIENNKKNFTLFSDQKPQPIYITNSTNNHNINQKIKTKKNSIDINTAQKGKKVISRSANSFTEILHKD